MNRRRFLQSASGLFLAPAIVKAESIMRVSPVVMPEDILDDDGDYIAFMHPDLARELSMMRKEASSARRYYGTADIWQKDKVFYSGAWR